ncbi:SAM-dependent methyltransferase [Streptomyces niveus]|uniref:SAM-dependent methyltransferase n=1 Tax=Streptomyces niveus TaxID=193462 RepID=UPI003CFE3B20
MLEQARRRPELDIGWILGDLESVSREREFDFVVMTGHAFQALLGDDELRAALGAARAALTDGGQFGFETRDPLTRASESWATETPVEVAAGAAASMRMTRQVRSVDGEIVVFASTFDIPVGSAPRHSDSTLRFPGADRPDVFLAGAGPAVAEGYGDGAGGPPGEGGPEIIAVARRTPA